ncbi:cytochrome c oxidase assembly protein [Granulicella mallensis]|uniref:Cytochrome c oxidase caa3-type, assembly factor CtaG-related protein n=1 Tax=Granulicella mallensis (strain ATCC BAA-1857 / DSM 23137 / MP5ACTX8) TaxID=682795 RepID=G8NPV7_GRAMM|nr:cytochrome c oxidase assembly protein [Granulicella mallensis]AEU37196.1 Cytochrome c oxidase caa3-type, assembly factor CtaG-related protein [Granulicella mallensis MP5ACTX8]
MPPECRAIFAEWSPPIFLTTAILLTAIIYTRGWFAIRKTRPELFPSWRLGTFLLGLATIWIAIGSPMDGFADALLSAHMVEHLLLMSFVPPLLLLGYPTVPLLRGLPRGFTRGLGPLFRLKFLRRLGHFLTKPVVAWIAMNFIFLGWHVPGAYDFALEHEHWHEFEHLCFLGSSILFWWPLIRPWPTNARYPGWYILPYLVAADIVNTALSAFLAFCDRPVYSYYVEQPNPFHVSPLSDQTAGAVIMWVVGSMAFLIPAFVITLRLLHQETRSRA